MRTSRWLILIIVSGGTAAILAGVFLHRAEVGFFAVMLIVLCALAVLMYYRVLHPMQELESVITPLAREHAAANSRELVEKLQQMILENQRITEEEYTLQMLKKQAELNALQSQINPHFLYLSS